MNSTSAKHIRKYALLSVAIIMSAAIFIAGQPVYAVEVQSPVKLHGAVSDIQGKPITGSAIYIYDVNNTLLGDTSSNASGLYEIQVPVKDQYRVYVSVGSQDSKYGFSYVPQNKNISLRQIGNTVVDFRLKPGATIIINSFDQEGKLLRNKEFRLLIGEKSFSTDLSNLPNYSYFGAIHDKDSLWQWDQAKPAFVVCPKELYRFYFQWEVSDFGKVLLSIDNNGKGYSLDKQGDQLSVNLNYELSRSQLVDLERTYQQYKLQGYTLDESISGGIESSKAIMQKAAAILAEDQPDMKKAVAELDRSLRLTLATSENLQLQRARADIQTYRKGTAVINIIDQKGNPVKGASIAYSQTSNDFLFGATPMGLNGSYDQRLAQLLKSAGINHSNITCRWGRIESSPGSYNWENIDKYQDIQTQLDDGFRLTGNLSMWNYRNTIVQDDFVPDYMTNMDFEALKTNVYAHMYALSERYQGKIDTWEINEMNLAWANALDLNPKQKLEITRVFVDAVKAANPKANILHNSTALPFEFGLQGADQDTVPYPSYLNNLKDNGVPIDIIGLEFYYSGVSTTGYSQPVLDLTSVSYLLDQYGSFGKPIYVNELSAPSVQVKESGWWHRPWDEKTQAEYVEKFYTIAFSKPEVKLINWSWGSSDQDAFTISGGLLDSSLKEKPSYFALKQLVEKWRSSGQAVVSSEGQVKVTGFAGDYDISYSAQGGRTTTTKIHIDEQMTSEFIIKIAVE